MAPDGTQDATAAPMTAQMTAAGLVAVLAGAGFRVTEAQAQEMLAAYGHLERMKARVRSGSSFGADLTDHFRLPDDDRSQRPVDRGGGTGHQDQAAVAGRADGGVSRPHRARRSAAQCLHHRDRGTRAGRGARRGRRDRGRPLARTAARHSGRAQGRVRDQGHCDHGAFAPADRPRARAGFRRRRAARGGRRNPARQARLSRIRLRRAGVGLAVAAGPQSVEPGAFHRRLVERRRCRGRRRHDPGRDRFRHQRLGAQPRRAVRNCRPQADL